MTERPVLDLLESLLHHAAQQPDEVAVRCEGRALTYRELAQRSEALASLCERSGVGRDDRIAFVGRESVDYYAALFAAARLGAVLVPVNWRLTADEVRHILDDSEARVVFADPGQAQVAPYRDRVLWTDQLDVVGLAPGPDLPRVRADPDTPVAQLYTSGTTGLPKGVVLAHRSFFAVLSSLREAGLDWITVDPDDRCLVGIPGFHIGGLWFACQAFVAGAEVVGMAEFDPGATRQLIVDRRITSGIFVPAMLRSLLDATPLGADDFASMRQTIYGGAPISDALLERCLRQIGGRFAQIYGLTETGNTAICLPPEEHVAGSPRLRAAGRPYPCVQIEIRDDTGGRLGPGQIGEVHLKTPAAMVEYWGRPDATSETLVEGWIRTGDAGSLDHDGFLYLHDRLNDMIVVGGENVYPAEVENVLARHPGVADVAVIGVPDDITGESVVAHVQLRDGATVTTRDLLAGVRPHLATFKLPRRFVITDHIPRNPSGKVLRRELRETYWSGRDRRVN